MTQELEHLPHDPLELAQQFVTGRSLKRGETIQMVKNLLELLELKRVAEIEIVQEVHEEVKLPKCHVTVELTPEKGIFVGHDANRIYSPEEALAFAEKLTDAVARARQ